MVGNGAKNKKGGRRAPAPKKAGAPEKVKPSAKPSAKPKLEAQSNSSGAKPKGLGKGKSSSPSSPVAKLVEQLSLRERLAL